MGRFDIEDQTFSVLPFRVVVDTREQAPFHFTNIDNLIVPLTTNKALESGDYSIEGLEALVSIERKSVGDFCGSITSDRDRFQREMRRLADLDYAAVVIEGSWPEFQSDARRSRVTTATIQGTMIAWSMDYGVHFFPCMSRRHAEVMTLRILQRYWKKHQAELEAMKAYPATVNID